MTKFNPKPHSAEDLGFLGFALALASPAAFRCRKEDGKNRQLGPPMCSSSLTRLATALAHFRGSQYRIKRLVWQPGFSGQLLKSIAGRFNQRSFSILARRS